MQYWVCRGVPLDNAYTDTIYFTSAGARSGYFTGKSVVSGSGATVQRISQGIASPRVAYTMRIPQNVSQVENCNYLVFRNSGAAGSKYYYAFITDCTYINERNTELRYEIDHYQTWADETAIGECFVEREHPLTDFFGDNTQDEPINLGKHIIDTSSTQFFNDFYICVLLADSPGLPGTVDWSPVVSALGQNPEPRIVDNIYTGTGYVIVPVAQYQLIETVRVLYELSLKSDAIVGMYMCPWNPEAPPETVFNSGFTRTTVFDSYTGNLRWNKIFTYPYTFLELRSSTGDSVMLYPEQFGDGGIQFRIDFSGMVPAMAQCTPLNYSNYNLRRGYPYSVVLEDNPMCAWKGSAFGDWLSQNGPNLALKNIGAKMADGGSESMGVGSLGKASLIDTGLQMGQALLRPNYIKGKAVNNNINYATERVGFEIIRHRIDNDHMDSVLDFWDEYGYAVNTVKVPELEGHEPYNYVKTKDCVITGGAPPESMRAIRGMFNNGVKLWHGDIT